MNNIVGAQFIAPTSSTYKTPKALVLRAPGINCEKETAHACRLVGFEADVLHINTLLKAPDSLLDYALLVIPGGFSYGDDLGAGTLLAKNLTIHLGSQLQRFIDEGRLILGICNGFQVLVRAGLLPGNTGNIGNTENGLTVASLTDNTSAQFECRWITLNIEPSKCIFTQGIDHLIELPVAHGEGQFVLADPNMLATLEHNGQIPLVYATRLVDQSPDPHKGGHYISHESISSPKRNVVTPLVGVRNDFQVTPGQEVPYPNNPNGSIGNIAGVCNARGNVLGLMPHPERFVSALQHPQRRSTINGEGDGLLIFKNAFNYVINGEGAIHCARKETYGL